MASLAPSPRRTTTHPRPDDHEGWLAAAERFADEEVAPVADQVDRDAAFPHATVRRMGEEGLLGLMVPPAFGGAFHAHATYYGVTQRIARRCVTHAMTLLSHSLCCKTLVLFADPEQKLRYLPDMARGARLGAVAMTEPGAGSDLAGLSTTATPDTGGGHVLRGQKHFITNGGVAGLIVTLAAIAGREPPFHTSLFAVESDMTGLILGKKEDKLGFRGSDTRELFFDGIAMAPDKQLGGTGKGILAMQQAMESSKVAFSAMALGVAESAFAITARTVKRRQLRQGAAAVEAQRIAIAEMEIELECCRQLIRLTAERQDRGQRAARESAMCKVQSSEMAQRVTAHAMRILGPDGVGRQTSIERHVRDARLFAIAEGTNEIQKQMIGSACLRSAR